MSAGEEIKRGSARISAKLIYSEGRCQSWEMIPGLMTNWLNLETLNFLYDALSINDHYPTANKHTMFSTTHFSPPKKNLKSENTYNTSSATWKWLKECVFVIYWSFAQSSNQEISREHDSWLWRVWSEDRDGWWERVTWGLISGAGAWHYVHCTMCHLWPVVASGAAIGQSHGPMTEADPSGLFNPDFSQKIYSLP